MCTIINTHDLYVHVRIHVHVHVHVVRLNIHVVSLSHALCMSYEIWDGVLAQLGSAQLGSARLGLV